MQREDPGHDAGEAPGSGTLSDDAWMSVATLLRPQGRRGELLAEASADSDLFIAGRIIFYGNRQDRPDLPLRPVQLEACWQPTGRNAGRLVLKLRGVDSISAAELVAGQSLFVRVDELPELAADTYRVRDLTGCLLLDGSSPVGTILDLQFPVAADGRTRLEDAPDLLVVQPLASRAAPASSHPHPPVSEQQNPAEPVLVPFVRAWLREVDLHARQVRMSLPPGLFDLAD